MKKIYLLFISILTLGSYSVIAQCSADFQYFVNGSSVFFQDSSFYSPNATINHHWNFGDGSVGNGTNPNHTYGANGTYNVCLTISDSTFTCFDTICKTVTIVTNQQPCMANFSIQTNSSNTVSFNSQITGGTAPYTYLWDFGDSSTATIANPTHTYTNAGTYRVVLIVTDANAVSCAYSSTITINTCTANFSYSVMSNGTVNFSNLSNPINPTVGISWNFGDGSGSNLTHPTHSYTASNSYVVTLNIFDSTSNCSATYSDTINVQIGNPSSCNASFSKAKDSTVMYGVILYNTSSNLSSHIYTWDFGDGTTGSGRTPVHQYQSFGSYLVCITITDTILNCTSTFCDTVGLDTLGNLKSGFGLTVKNPTVTSISEIQDLASINIYPNPTTSAFFIDFSAIKSEVNIQVYDVTGKLVLADNKWGGMTEKFDITSLKDGLYFVQIAYGDSTITKKIIKQ